MIGFVRIAFVHAFRHLLLGTPFQDAIRETIAGGDMSDSPLATGSLPARLFPQRLTFWGGRGFGGTSIGTSGTIRRRH